MPKGNGNVGSKKAAKGTAKPARPKGLPKAEPMKAQRKGDGMGDRSTRPGITIRA